MSICKSILEYNMAYLYSGSRLYRFICSHKSLNAENQCTSKSKYELWCLTTQALFTFLFFYKDSTTHCPRKMCRIKTPKEKHLLWLEAPLYCLPKSLSGRKNSKSIGQNECIHTMDNTTIYVYS